MKFKITYQQNNKLKNITLEANQKSNLKDLENYPKNVIKIREIKNSINMDSFKIQKSSTKKDVYEMFSQLDLMLEANLSFHESIDLLLKSKHDKKIDEVLHHIKNSFSSSKPISQSLQKYKSYLGETVILFLQLGFENGNIKQSVHSLVEVLKEDINSKEKLQEVMRYPLILIASLLISVVMIFIYVLPNFDFLFQLLKDDIPVATKILLFIKDMFIYHSLWIVLTLIIFISGVIVLIKKNQQNFDKLLLLKIPVVSKVLQNYYYYRLFLSMAIIVKSKYQFQIAIEHSKDIVNNLYVKKQMDFVLRNIKSGSSIATAYEKSGLFDSLIIKLLYTAEYTNEYEKILEDIANLYQKQFQKSLKNFSSTLEPTLILIIALIVLWLILAIMLPIWNLGSVIY